MKSMILNSILLVLLTFSLNAADGKKLFESDFSSTNAALAQFKGLKNKERVTVKDGILSINAFNESSFHKNVSQWLQLHLPEKMPKVFSIQIDFSVENRKAGSNFFRCDIGKVTLLNRQYGGTYLVGKKEVVLKKMGGTPSNREFSLLLVSFPDKLLIYRDGKKIGTAPISRKIDNSISVCPLNQKTIISKILITEGDLSKTKISNNLFYNSSFEKLCNNYPEYWGTPHWGIKGRAVLDMDTFREEYKTVSGSAFDGNIAFMIKPSKPLNWHKQLLNCWVNLEPNKTYTYSAYIKSDTVGAPFSLYVRFGSKKLTEKGFNASKNWKRYSFTFKTKETGNAAQISFYPTLSSASYYIDAVQLEEGATPSAYVYNKNDLKDKNKKFKRPSFRIKNIIDKPIIDGMLDDKVWKTIIPLKMKNAIKPDDTLKDPTNVYLAYDADNIYVGLECLSKNMDKLKANIKKHKGPVWQDDDVEFFFKPDPQGNSYFQFAVNTIGTKYEGRAFADVAWLGQWDCKVKKYKDRYTIEAKIPFATLNMGKNMKSLVFNVVRANTHFNEFSALAPTFGTFLNYRYWGNINFKNAVGGFSINTVALSFKNMNSNFKKLKFLLTNGTQGKRVIAITTRFTAGKFEHLSTKNIKINPGTTRQVVFDELSLPNAVPISLQINGIANGKQVISKSEEFQALQRLKLIPEFSYFSSEKQFCFKVLNRAGKLPGGKLRWRVMQKKLSIQQGCLDYAGETDKKFPIKPGLEPGNYHLEIKAIDKNNKITAQTSTSFNVYKSVVNERKTNLFRQTIVIAPGKEFFIWGIYWGDSIKNGIDTMGKAGFNLLTVPDNIALRKDGIDYILSPKEAEALKVGISFYSASCKLTSKNERVLKDSQIATIKKFVNKPGLLNFDFFDESKCWKITDANINKEMARIKSLTSPRILTQINENDYGIMRQTDFSSTDIVSLDHYTIPERDISTITTFLKTMKAHNKYKVLNYIAQNCGHAYGYGRGPTPTELVNQVYQAFALEIFNIVFFANTPLSKYSIPTLKRVKNERNAIDPSKYLNGSPVKLKINEEKISASARKVGNVITVIAVNITRTSCSSVKFFIPSGKIKTVDVKFENRKIQGKNKLWKDDFKPLERHVYQIILK